MMLIFLLFLVVDVQGHNRRIVTCSQKTVLGPDFRQGFSGNPFVGGVIILHSDLRPRPWTWQPAGPDLGFKSVGLRGKRLLCPVMDPGSGERQGRLDIPVGALQMYIGGLFK